MSIHKNKMVSFRLSADEFKLMEKAARRHGAQTLSEFARYAILRLVGTDRKRETIPAEVSLLNARVEAIYKQMENLSKIMRDAATPESINSSNTPTSKREASNHHEGGRLQKLRCDSSGCGADGALRGKS